MNQHKALGKTLEDMFIENQRDHIRGFEFKDGRVNDYLYFMRLKMLEFIIAGTEKKIES